MKRNRQRLLTIAASLAATTSIFAPAWAARWQTTVEGPDVFGTVKVISSVAGTRDILSVQCNAEDVLKLVMLYSAIPSQIDAMSGHSTPAKLLIRVDDGDVNTFDAEQIVWNKTHWAVVAEGRTAELIATIRAFGGAKKSIGVGTEVAGARNSSSFDVTGSTAAIKTVTEKCNLGGA